MRLDITVNGKNVGHLTQTGINAYIFEYAENVKDKDCISLSMLPSQKRSWESNEIPHALLTSLPEGGVRQLLSRKRAPDTKTSMTDMQLLGSLGRHLVGRVHASPSKSALQRAPAQMPSKDLAYLLQNLPHDGVKQELFDSLLDFAGVSGGFDKVLSRSPATQEAAGKTHTFTQNEWIVKMDDEDHPALAANEYLGMELCRRSGLTTPEVKLSDDMHRLLVARFDIKPDGTRFGFEDFCSLMGQHPNMKFSGSMEKVCAVTRRLLSKEHVETGSKQLYQHHLVNMAIRNGDAHLKNFAVLHNGPKDVRLSPVYDVLTMSAYAPRAQNGDAYDNPSLTVGGSHRWPTSKELQQLATRLSLSASEQSVVADAVCEAMLTMIPDFEALAEVDETMRPTIARIAYLWGCGIEIHSQSLAQDLYACSQNVSDPDRGTAMPRHR